MGVRHVHGCGFMADVDDTDALAGHVIPDWLDVAALETEDAVNATGFEKARDPGGGSGIVGVEVDGVGHHLSPIMQFLALARSWLGLSISFAQDSSYFLLSTEKLLHFPIIDVRIFDLSARILA